MFEDVADFAGVFGVFGVGMGVAAARPVEVDVEAADDLTRTRSARKTASSMLWVMNSTVLPISCHMFWTSGPHERLEDDRFGGHAVGRDHRPVGEQDRPGEHVTGRETQLRGRRDRCRRRRHRGATRALAG